MCPLDKISNWIYFEKLRYSNDIRVNRIVIIDRINVSRVDRWKIYVVTIVVNTIRWFFTKKQTVLLYLLPSILWRHRRLIKQNVNNLFSISVEKLKNARRRNFVISYSTVFVGFVIELHVNPCTYSREIIIRLCKTVHLKNPRTRVIIHLFTCFKYSFQVHSIVIESYFTINLNKQYELTKWHCSA